MQKEYKTLVYKTSTEYPIKTSKFFTGTCPTILTYTAVHLVSATVMQLQM